MIYVWLCVFAVCVILEFITMELVSIWLAVGALVGLILALCGVMMEIQIAVVAVVSIVCILALRKVFLKLLNKSKDKTNLDLIVGSKVKVIKPITKDELGSVKVNGIVWSIKSIDDKTIKQDSMVEIVRIEGNKLIVKKLDNKEKLEKE